MGSTRVLLEGVFVFSRDPLLRRIKMYYIQGEEQSKNGCCVDSPCLLSSASSLQECYGAFSVIKQYTSEKKRNAV